MTTRKAWLATTILTLAAIGVALLLAILADNALLSALATPPTPTPCADDEERLPDGICQVVYPPEEFQHKPDPQRDDSLYPPPPNLFPSLTPTPTPVSGPTDLPATGAGAGLEQYEKIWCKGRTSGVLEACAVRIGD